MPFAKILQRWMPDLGQMVWRFPLASATSVILWLVLMAMVANGDIERTSELALGLVAVFLAAVNGHVFAEGRRFSLISNLAVTLAAIAVVASVYWFFRLFQTNELYLFTGLALSLLVSPFLRAGVEQGAIWLWGQRFGLSALLAIIVGLIFAGGFSAIVATLEYLLGVPWPIKTYSYIWLTACGLVGPLYGLSLLPDDFDEVINIADHHNTLLERGVSVLVNYVIVPMVVIYAVIIHAYAIKIAASGILPKGEVGTIVTLFALAATAAWLISWPWRETGTWLLRLFSRHWFWLIPVPAVLLAIAVARRISDYGITPERFGLIVVAIWIGILFFYLLFRRNRTDMRAVIGTMAALMLLSSSGPWGANGMTAKSQWTRLQALLVSNGMLKEEKIEWPLPVLAPETKQQLHSLVLALGDVHDLSPLVSMLPENERPQLEERRFDAWNVTGSVLAKLGLADAWQSVTSLNYTTQRPLNLKLAQGTRLSGPHFASSVNANDTQSKADGQPLAYRAFLEQNTLRITGVGLDTQVPIPRVVEEVKAAQQKGGNPLLMLDIGNNAKIAIYEVYGDSTASQPVSSMAFWLLLDEN